MKQSQLGRRIRKRRQALCLSARAVALAAGITPAYLSMLETGRNPKTQRAPTPSFEIVARLAGVLEIDLRQLIGDSDQRVRAARLSGARAMPSGIPGAKIHRGDHVLLLSAAHSTADFDRTLDFTAAGLRNGDACIVRLPPDMEPKRVRTNLTGARTPLDRLVLRPWRESVLQAYRPHHFTRRDTIAAHRTDIQLARHLNGTRLRYATPDASAYLRWLKQPKEIQAVLDYEHIWPGDVRRLWGDDTIVLLCLYRMKDLDSLTSADLAVTRMVLQLLASHETVIFLTEDDEVFAGREAVRAIVGRLDLRTLSRREWQSLRRSGDRFGIWDAA